MAHSNKRPSVILLGVLALATAGVIFALSRNISSSTASASETQQAHPKWEVTSLSDTSQFNNPTVPVAVVRVVSGLTEPDERGKKQYVVKEVIVENRSTKNVASVTLRWLITPMDDRMSILQRGEMNPHILTALHKTLLTGRRQTLKLSLPKVGHLLKGVPNADAVTRFAVIIGVSQVAFDDGSIWKEETTEVAEPLLTNPSKFF